MLFFVTALDILLYGKTRGDESLNCLSICHKFPFSVVIDNRSRVCGNGAGRNNLDIGRVFLGYVPE